MSIAENPLMINGVEIRWADAELQRVALQPGDTLVVFVPRALATEAAVIAHIVTPLKEAFPGHRVMVFEEGLRLGVLSETSDL